MAHASLGEFHDVERAAGGDEYGDDAHQHKGAAEDGEHQKFHGRVLFASSAPDGYEQVHGQQLQFPEQEEEQEVQGGKYAHDGSL